MKAEQFLGTWQLRRCYEERDGVVTVPHKLGEGANGCIHYLPDGRMAVLIQYGGCPRLPTGLAQATDAELAAVSRRFFAYGGTYSFDEDRVIHHLDICSNPNDVGADYVRAVQFSGNFLTLSTPPEIREGQAVTLKLEWESMAPRA